MMKKDQYVLVNWSGKDQANGVYEVVEIADVEILSNSTLTKFSKGSSSDINSDGNRALFKSVVTGGTEYKTSQKTYYNDDVLDLYDDDRLVNKTYNIYLDKYGYAIGVEEVDRVDNYMFITGVDTNTVNRYAVQADASAIFLDGTMEAVKIDMKAARDLVDQSTYNALVGTDAEIQDNVKGGSLINKWFTYSVGNDGVYEVVLVKDDVAVRENKARAGQFRTLSSDEAADMPTTAMRLTSTRN